MFQSEQTTLATPTQLHISLRFDSEGHCYITALNIKSLRKVDTGAYALQLDNEVAYKIKHVKNYFNFKYFRKGVFRGCSTSLSPRPSSATQSPSGSLSSSSSPFSSLSSIDVRLA